MKWLKALWQNWKRKDAALINARLLAEQRQQRLAEALGFNLMDALLNRKNVCKRCFKIYTPTQYEFGERFFVRSILHVPDSEPDPMLCDFCFNSIQQEVNQQMTNIGTSNSQPPNLVLRRSVEKT